MVAAPDGLGASDRLRKLIDNLREAWQFGHPIRDLEVIETHISYVLLTGDYAYKFKKPVDFGFVDFRSLAGRQHYCLEELRLNQRTAPTLYLGVSAFTGSYTRPHLGHGPPVLEYAVRMRQFDNRERLDYLADRGDLGADHIRQLASRIAELHREAAPFTGSADPVSSFRRHMVENFVALEDGRSEVGHATRTSLHSLRAWSEAEFEQLLPTLRARQRQNRIRECHGDLHLANMVLLEDGPRLFDALEFSDTLRWIDTLSDALFTEMDLRYRQQPGLANLFLASYLEASGDYGGLALRPIFLTYRALVRAKVDRLMDCQQACDEHVALATELSNRPSGRPRLIITHGVSGSGKSWITGELLPYLPAIRIRSDLERKRIHDLPPLARGNEGLDRGLYRHAATTATYRRMRDAARQILACGLHAVVDATFLQTGQRQCLRALAEELGAAFVILRIEADEQSLRRRIARRLAADADPSDADQAVLSAQLASRQPLTPAEEAHTVSVQSTAIPARKNDKVTYFQQLAEQITRTD